MQKRKTIGMRLREAFKRLGLSITEVAKITEIPYSTLQDYLNDKRIPGGTNLQKIFMHLHISTDWLLTGEGPMFKESTESMVAVGTGINQIKGENNKTGHIFVKTTKDKSTEKEEFATLKNIDPKIQEIIELLLEGYYTPRLINEFLKKLKKIKEAMKE